MSLTIDLRRPDAVHVFFNKTARVWWDGVFQIIEAGGDVNGEKYGITIMTRAANEGNAEAVRRLLRYGAHTQKASQAKDTPLMIAAEHGHVECVDALIRGGADINIEIDNGKHGTCCALERAAACRSLAHSTLCVELLLAAGEIAMAAADTRALDGDFTLREMRVIQKAIIPLLLRFGSRIEKVERLALAGRASDSPEQLRQRKAICDELGRYLVSVRAAGSWAKWQLQRHKPFVTMLEKCLPDNIPTEVTAVVVAFWVHACDYC